MGTQEVAKLNLQWAYALIDGLAAAGLERVVMSPGSRSTPLVQACQRHPAIRTWIQIDERSAAFFALGMSRLARQPTALVATSGSAPAHWYPAVMEAAQADLPLLLLTADRPPELHDWCANQTADQQRLFGAHVRAFHDPGTADPKGLAFVRALGVKAAQQSLWPQPGPVQINLPFREPLVADVAADLPPPAAPMLPSRPELPADPAQLERVAKLLSGGPGLIVCGPDDNGGDYAGEVTRLAAALDCPVIADPLSGLRFGEHDGSRVLTRYDAFLRPGWSADAREPGWVLRFGAPPVSRVLLEYLQQCACPQILCSRAGHWPDPLHRTLEMVRADPVALCSGLMRLAPSVAPPHWLQAWRDMETAADPEGFLHSLDDRPFEGRIIRELLQQLPAQSLLFSGNSMPIREFDSWSGTRRRPLRLLANRGLSGIDGNVSSVLGLAAAAGRPVAAVLGDLTLVHDLNGLLAADGVDALILVLNNGGGGIFGYLPQRSQADFERCWLTPSGLDIADAARCYRVGFRRVNRQSDLRAVLQAALAQPGVSLLEVVIDRELSIQRHLGYWAGPSA